MSSRARRKEKLEKVLRRLCVESSSGTVIIVEGRKDEASLRRLGVTGRIVCFKSSGKGLVDFLSHIHAKKAIVLTDFDNEGKAISARIEEELAHINVATDNVLRRKLGALVRQEVRTIEGLFRFVEKMRAEET